MFLRVLRSVEYITDAVGAVLAIENLYGIKSSRMRLCSD